MKLFFLLIIIFLVAVSCNKKIDTRPFGDVADKEFNDTYEDAVVVSDLNSPIIGFFENKWDNQDADFYRVKFPSSNTSYRITMTAVPDADATITILDTSKRVLLSVNERGVGEGEMIWKFYPKFDEVYMKISAISGSNERNPYILSLKSFEKDKTEEIEPNNTEQTSMDITPDSTRKGYIIPGDDRDYYHIVYPEERGYCFTIKAETLSNVDINFTLINKLTGSEKLINRYGWGGSEELLFVSSAKGDYYIRVAGAVNRTNIKDPLYYIKIEEKVAEKNTGFEMEFNDTLETATELINLEEVDGVISQDDADFFRFNVINETESVNISVSRFAGDIIAEVFDSAGVKIDSFSGDKTLERLSAGTYYIKLSKSDTISSFYRLFLNIRYGQEQ